MIYVIGLTAEMADEETLTQYEYLGQYGQIQRVAVTIDKGSRQVQSSVSAYVTFERQLDASLALLGIQRGVHGIPSLKASFGMTKYCSYFLAKMDCQNADCAYYHGEVSESDCVWKVR